MTFAALLLSFVATAAADAPAGAPLLPRFVEPGPEESGLTAVTVAAKTPWIYVIDNIGTGVAMLDYDLDGDLDIFQVQASSLEGFPDPKPTDHLYRNDGGGHFTDVTKEAGLGDSKWGQGVSVADYDNDGDPDLFVSSIGPDRLYQNQGDGTFREVGVEAGIANNGWSTGSAFFDANGDGLLDLYVALYIDFDAAKIPPRGDPNHPCTFRGVPVVCGPMGLPQALDVFYLNNGDGTFTNVNDTSGMKVDRPSFGLGVVTADVDDDGDPDIFVGNDSEPNFLYINDGTGHFSEEGLLRGVAYSGDGRGQASMGCAFGDPDGDGDLDLFVTHFSHDYPTLYINDGTGFFEDETLKAGLVESMIPMLSWGTTFTDFDNDGDEDIFITNSHVYPEADDAHIGSSFLQRCQLFLNDGHAKFTELKGDAAGPALEHVAAHRGAAFGDLDEDGDVDVVVTRMFDRLGFYRNDLPPGNHWINFRFYGTVSNRDAVGTRIVVHSGDRKWLKELQGGGSFESASDPRLHIGLGSLTRVDKVDIRWPSGQKQSLGPFEVDRTISLIEPEASQKPLPGR